MRLPQIDILLNGRLALIGGKIDAFITKLLDELCVQLLNSLVIVFVQPTEHIQILSLRFVVPFQVAVYDIEK